MPKIVPVRNVSPVLVDVKKPGVFYYSKKSHFLNLKGVSSQPLIVYQSKKKNVLWYFLVSFFLVVTFSTYIFFNYFHLKSIFFTKSHKIISNFLTASFIFKDFHNLGDNYHLLVENQQLLSDLDSLFKKYGLKQLINFLGVITPNFKGSGYLLEDLQVLNQEILSVFEIVDALKAKGFYYFKNDGQAFVSRLKDLIVKLESIIEKSESFQKEISKWQSLSPVFGELNNLISLNYLSYKPQFYQGLDFLKNLVALLERKEDVHLLFLFQNPSEIRPAGGFIGSYADLVIRNGQLYFLDVRDIYDPDGQLKLKVTPPQPLQVTNYLWSARDANWFFDFPTSAEKVLYFLENSEMYKEPKITFDVVIALNIKVVKDLLKITGPIYLEEYDLSINESNFLKEVQREVEMGKDKAAGYPKRILKVLTPLLLEKIENFNDLEKESFFEMLVKNFKNKEIMVYAKEKKLQDFFDNQKIAGAVYDLPYNFFGTYLAVVNANIEGGKSDAFVKQEIELEVVLDNKGYAFNNLTIKRTHQGNKEKELWWRKDNQNYLQVFVNENASLVLVKGFDKMPKKFREINYELENYQKDELVESFEKNQSFSSNYQTFIGNLFNKTVFGGWFKVLSGQSRVLEMRYQIPPQIKKSLSEKEVYQFIFEKQSGVDTDLKVKLIAPYGYYWQETATPVYSFEKFVEEGLIVLNLNLVKK